MISVRASAFPGFPTTGTSRPTPEPVIDGFSCFSILKAQGKPITGGMVNHTFPTLSPDGRRMLFLQSTNDYRIVAASLKDASLRTWVRSQLRTGMPLWAPKGERFVYDTSSHGEAEIWLRESDGAERPVLTQCRDRAGLNGCYPALP